MPPIPASSVLPALPPLCALPLSRPWIRARKVGGFGGHFSEGRGGLIYNLAVIIVNVLLSNIAERGVFHCRHHFLEITPPSSPSGSSPRCTAPATQVSSFRPSMPPSGFVCGACVADPCHPNVLVVRLRCVRVAPTVHVARNQSKSAMSPRRKPCHLSRSHLLPARRNHPLL